MQTIFFQTIVTANSLSEAKQKYFDFVYCSGYITIYKTQQKKANKMYVDTTDGKTVQTGFVFIGSTDIEFNNEYKKRYVSLWCTIYELKNVFE